MSYDDFKEICRIAWDVDYNYPYINRYKNRDQGRYCTCNEIKKRYRMHS